MPVSAKKLRPRLALEPLEGRTVPATLTHPAGVLTYDASANVANNLTISHANGRYLFLDKAEAIHLSGVLLPQGNHTHQVTFSDALINAVTVKLKDGGD